MEKELSVKEKVDMVFEQLATTKPNKTKKLKLPRKAKVRKGKRKKGWIGIVRIDENGNMTGEKAKLEDSTIRLKDKTYHATDGSEIGYWDSKFPVIFQPTWRKNPLKIKKEGQDDNETYGHKYIMARMLGDTIKVKAGQAKALLWIVGIGIAGYFGYMLATGQL